VAAIGGVVALAHAERGPAPAYPAAGGALPAAPVGQPPTLSKEREYTQPLCPGTNIRYTVILANSSGDPTPRLASIFDPVPRDTTVVPGSVTGGSYNAGTNRVEWFGLLGGGQEHALAFSVTVNGGVSNGTVITNTATGLVGELPAQTSVGDTVSCVTATPTATGTGTPSATPTPSATTPRPPSPTATRTPTPTLSPSPTATRSPTPILTATPTPTTESSEVATPTPTSTLTPTDTPRPTDTATPTSTPTASPTATPTSGPVRQAKEQEGGGTQSPKVWLKIELQELKLVWNGDRGESGRNSGEVFVASWAYWPSDTEKENPQQKTLELMKEFLTGESRKIPQGTVYLNWADCPVADHVSVEWFVWEDDTDKTLDSIGKKIAQIAGGVAKGKAPDELPDPSGLIADIVGAFWDWLTKSDDDPLGRYSGTIFFPNPCLQEQPIEKKDKVELDNLVSDALWKEAENEDGQALTPKPDKIGTLHYRISGGKVQNKFSAKAKGEDPPRYSELTLVDLGQPDEDELATVMALAAALPGGPLAVRYRFFLDVDNNLATGAQGVPADGADYELRVDFQAAESPHARLMAYDPATRAFQEAPQDDYAWTLGMDRAHIYQAVSLSALGHPTGPIAGWGVVETAEGVASVVPRQPASAAPMISPNRDYTGLPPSIVAITPGDGALDVLASNPICVTFGKSMDRAKAEAALRIAPAAAGNVTWQGHTLCFNPTSLLSRGTRFQVSVDATATDRVGTPLDGNGDGIPGDSFAWTFWTSDQRVLTADASGLVRSRFGGSEPIHLVGQGLPPQAPLHAYMIEHPPGGLVEGLALVDRSGDGITTVTADERGTLAASLLSPASPQLGEFNAVVDVNGNATLELGQDLLDRFGIGFLVAPSRIYLPSASKQYRFLPQAAGQSGFWSSTVTASTMPTTIARIGAGLWPTIWRAELPSSRMSTTSPAPAPTASTAMTYAPPARLSRSRRSHSSSRRPSNTGAWMVETTVPTTRPIFMPRPRARPR
jgi:uncharacterized repeat protein (TIGR01451 family)